MKMKDEEPTFLSGLGFTMAVKALSFVFLLITFALVALLMVLAETTKIDALRIAAVPVLLFGLFVTVFASRQIVGLMFEHPAMSFPMAVVHTWYHYLMLLAFVPLLGPLLQRFTDRRKSWNPFVEDGQRGAGDDR